MRHALFIGLSLTACGPEALPPVDTGLDGLSVRQLGPESLVPGTRLAVLGDSFVDRTWGKSRLRLRGTLDGEPADIALEAEFMSYEEMVVRWLGGIGSGLPAASGRFRGQAQLEVDSEVDGELHVSPPLHVTLEVSDGLEPRIDRLESGVSFINEPLVVDGEGFLLGEEEGTTYAVVEGCYRVAGERDCLGVGPVEVAAKPESRFDRTRVVFPFAPKIAGIKPGRFEGTVRMRNVAGDERESEGWVTEYDILPPMVLSVSPESASLGQYVDIRGGGFVGTSADEDEGEEETEVTLLEFDGTLTGGERAERSTFTLLPQFVAGPLVRYVVNEEDALGLLRVGRRTETSRFEGMVRPIIKADGTTMIGDPTPVSFGLAPVKQVVWVSFLPEYVESLRNYGLRAADSAIRKRIFAVIERNYEGINIEFREEEPEDFAYYARIDIAGPDVAHKGLIGYDNTPIKDLNNLELNDYVGGFNATTKNDMTGDPLNPYGGVYVETFIDYFSVHPGRFRSGLSPRHRQPNKVFDRIFDPFRPDVGGDPARGWDLDDVPELTSGAKCPAPSGQRKLEIACGIWVLGTMIGSTAAHEVAHTLGLANPTDTNIRNTHLSDDRPNRLMEAGNGRSFFERAEIKGQGPSIFTESEYRYLRKILPSKEPATTYERPQ